MSVYWRTVKRGQNLVVEVDNDREEIIGGYRESKRGIDAYAKTFGYEPDRSKKGFETLDDAKTFVEAFRPWEIFGVQGVTVDTEVKPLLE